MLPQWDTVQEVFDRSQSPRKIGQFEAVIPLIFLSKTSCNYPAPPLPLGSLMQGSHPNPGNSCSLAWYLSALFSSVCPSNQLSLAVITAPTFVKIELLRVQRNNLEFFWRDTNIWSDRTRTCITICTNIVKHNVYTGIWLFLDWVEAIRSKFLGSVLVWKSSSLILHDYQSTTEFSKIRVRESPMLAEVVPPAKPCMLKLLRHFQLMSHEPVVEDILAGAILLGWVFVNSFGVDWHFCVRCSIHRLRT